MNRTIIRLAALGGGFACLATNALADEPRITAPLAINATRISDAPPGASVTVIDREEIEESPARTLPDLLRTKAGVQARDLYGGTGAARATVDLRGFGAVAGDNTLILINGRRQNEFDLSSVNYANMPMEAIERIEILRGNSAAVLYGDGAVGGAINIVTRQAFAQDYAAASFGYGSFDTYEGNAGFGYAHENVAVTANLGFRNSDSYRDNNEHEQISGQAEIRVRASDAEFFVNGLYSDQELGLPGDRNIRLAMMIDQFEDDPTGTDTPNDYAEETRAALTGGVIYDITSAARLVLDGGLRHKAQTYFFDFGGGSGNFGEVDMNTWSLTPRLDIDHDLGGLPAFTQAGLDYYYIDYTSERRPSEGIDPPIHVYSGDQHSAAAYAQTTLSPDAALDIHLGGRLQYFDLRAEDNYDPANDPFPAFATILPDHSEDHVEWAASIGADYRLTGMVGLFARAGRSFRFANIDERIGSENGTFEIEPQTSWDVEAGTRLNFGTAELQASAYYMQLENEIRYDPTAGPLGFGANTNYDPTERYGVELEGGWRPHPDVRLLASVAWTQAKFRDGPYDGNDVPLVAEWTGSLGAFWDFFSDERFGTHTLGVTFDYVGESRFENDEANFQPEIPDYFLVDLQLGGEIGAFTYELAVNNLFDESYYAYGVASATTFGAYNVFPLPGRTYWVRGGVRF